VLNWLLKAIRARHSKRRARLARIQADDLASQLKPSAILERSLHIEGRKVLGRAYSSTMPFTHHVSELNHAELRRTRARWTIAVLFIGYVPIMLGISRWIPSWETVVLYLWGLAMVVSWFRSLNIDWPRRNFQVREPDPPRDRNRR
jgi:hypothetical protein